MTAELKCSVVCCLQLYIDFFKNITYTNAASLVTALVSMAAIYVVQRWVNPKFKRKFKMPLPIELIVVCIQLMLQLTWNMLIAIKYFNHIKKK